MKQKIMTALLCQFAANIAVVAISVPPQMLIVLLIFNMVFAVLSAVVLLAIKALDDSKG